MDKAGSVARQVWQEFSPRDGEELACRDDGIIEVTVDGVLEGSGIDPDVPFGLYVSAMADRMQTVVTEGRQQMVPDCPLHPVVHPLQSGVVNGAAAWVCPWSKSLLIKGLGGQVGGNRIDLAAGRRVAMAYEGAPGSGEVVEALPAARGLHAFLPCRNRCCHCLCVAVLLVP